MIEGWVIAMSRIIDDRHEDWFRQLMKVVEEASGSRKSVHERVSRELQERRVKASPRKGRRRA